MIRVASMAALLVCLPSQTLPQTPATQPAQQGEVRLDIKFDRQPQPQGGPMLVEFTMMNVGESPIHWWCGGPGPYPGAEHFNVEVRYGADFTWKSVEATNGQYTQGSSFFSGLLKPGESIDVPLAIPISEDKDVSFRIQPKEWAIAKPAESWVQLSSDIKVLDFRRARLIQAAINQSPPFLRHVSEKYADEVVIDAMLKLVTVNNPQIAGAAARLLARQKHLPKDSGEIFVDLIPHWISRDVDPQCGIDVQQEVAWAALKTENDSARSSIIKQMQETENWHVKLTLIHALGTSPGDREWLERAADTIRNLQPPAGVSLSLDRARTNALTCLESRIRYPQRLD